MGIDRPAGLHFATRSEVASCNGMACTSHPLATQTALDILRRGGTAVDAAIGANSVLTVCEPHSCGVGGDLFAIVYEASAKKLHGLNASGRSPGRLTLEEFKRLGHKSIPTYGPLSVSVPGCVDGWFELHKKFGKLPMNALLQYAIDYAQNGFPLAPEGAIARKKAKKLFSNYPNFKQLFDEDIKHGEILKNTNLSKTLTLLGTEDFSQHKSDWIEPISTNYRGYDVYELPPNGQGLAALQMLNILEEYDFSKIEFGSFEHIHLFVEAKKIVYEDRAKFYSDLDYMKPGIIDKLISKEYARERRQLINMNSAQTHIELNEKLLTGDTVYLTTSDKDGNMVSLIQSNFCGFGSGCIPDGLGFMLQNRGELFSLKEGEANTYSPHKRPFHTIIPAFVMGKDKTPFLSFGVMGGAFQPLGHVQILMNIIDFKMNTQEAGDAPRIDHQGSSEPIGKEADSNGGTVTLESGFKFETIRQLMEVGHKIGWALPGSYGGYQAIRFNSKNNVYFGATDSRKDGHAAGY
ncbi:unnamed protein product [Didymodactylos carnosus]|uniref:Gamma-glutamyltransferase n=1 Tax=Didymodactylos carnosus TaxID=1234261 RepID=A0A814RT95_9BILA|nr:unnamed protein product [Didymodactylos carnosus]CAF1136206.1 unnamed protein product [Didymodactylos carnosus]CAF3800636.1 unnamed protein product [Didymodactylos carnosus]CAF3899833.1 unnamed protein product [Didymodactylos carnosus]